MPKAFLKYILAEVKLADQTLEKVGKKPKHLVCDKAYDSDKFRSELKK